MMSNLATTINASFKLFSQNLKGTFVVFGYWKPIVLHYLPLKHTVEYDSSQNDRGPDKYDHMSVFSMSFCESFSNKYTCENQAISCMWFSKKWAKLKNIYRLPKLCRHSYFHNIHIK